MKIFKPITYILLMSGLLILLSSCGERSLLSNVSFSADQITPNADRESDALAITFDLSRSAEISIYFTDRQGERYYFRDHVYHAPSIERPYRVLFSGVVHGYTLPGEDFENFTVEQRMLQNGDYTWTVEAIDNEGVTESVTGTVTIADADTALPELRGFSIFPSVFTPNRDGIDDRATINVHLTKDVEILEVFLTGNDGTRYYVQEHEMETELNAAGWHEFDYDAGVDLGADPPPNGTYPVTMQAQDAVGQWTVATGTLTIENGGVPRAYILNAEVDWSGEGVQIHIPLGETLYFTLTVENDSVVPLRTSGPPSGTVYDSDQNYATLEEYVQSGVFRVAIHCENSPTDHPWRWAIGSDEDLYVDDEGYTYLPAGARATVTGGIRFVDVIPARRTQYCYASLIHEDVEISQVNFRVDAIQVTIDEP